jgi:hypothetical protein
MNITLEIPEYIALQFDRIQYDLSLKNNILILLDLSLCAMNKKCINNIKERHNNNKFLHLILDEYNSYSGDKQQKVISYLCSVTDISTILYIITMYTCSINFEDSIDSMDNDKDNIDDGGYLNSMNFMSDLYKIRSHFAVPKNAKKNKN